MILGRMDRHLKASPNGSFHPIPFLGPFNQLRSLVLSLLLRVDLVSLLPITTQLYIGFQEDPSATQAHGTTIKTLSPHTRPPFIIFPGFYMYNNSRVIRTCGDEDCLDREEELVHFLLTFNVANIPSIRSHVACVFCTTETNTVQHITLSM